METSKIFSNLSENERILLGTKGVGVYEGCVLFFIIVGMIFSGRAVNYLCGNYRNPKHHPFASSIKHPGWSPKLRNIRSYFRYFYLIQAPAIWLIWLQMRNQEIPSQILPIDQFPSLFGNDESSLPTEFIPIELLETASIIGKNRRSSFFPFLDDLAPEWTRLVLYFFPHASPFFSSPQLALFIFQFYLSLSWPIFFFRWKKIGIAAIVSIIIWFALNFTIRSFWDISSTAATLLYPYLCWITTASALSVNLFLINFKKYLTGECKPEESKENEENTENTEAKEGEKIEAKTSTETINLNQTKNKKNRVKSKGCLEESDDETEEKVRKRNPILRIRHYFNGH